MEREEKSELVEIERPIYSAHLICLTFTKREISALEREDDARSISSGEWWWTTHVLDKNGSHSMPNTVG